MARAKKEDRFTAFMARMKQARERVGHTSESRVQWVLAFTKQDVAKLSVEERAEAGDSLRALHDAGRWHAAYSSGPTMPDELLMQIHGELRAGFEILFGDSRANEWQLPMPHGSAIHRMNSLDSKITRLQQYYLADERAAIIGSVVELLVKCQGRIRACEWCHEPFVRNKRQAHCTPECGQAKRNHRKKVRSAI